MTFCRNLIAYLFFTCLHLLFDVKKTLRYEGEKVEKPVRITVCQLANDTEALLKDWQQLVSHVKAEASDLVLLPEMPFYPWIAKTRQFDPETWQAAVAAHDNWLTHFRDLSPANIIGTRPINSAGRRLNEGFVWDSKSGYRAAHAKTYLPDEEGFWEATWYDRGPVDFKPVDLGQARVGFLICTELWFMQHARAYGQQAIHLLACPRATPRSTLDKWLAGGRAAAVVSGAFCLSSSLITLGGPKEMGGPGWIISPDGDVLATTSADHPIVTLEIDLSDAEEAKKTYPRYVLE